jgi:cytochrome d ubiquinol oxidase subunit II
VIRAIGPVWDGNEVWLLAAGGTLYFAFPLLYASSFSGFYLPLMMVLWLLMLRAIGIEFRTHIQETVWQGFFDTVFGVASILLAIFFGAALGNVVRGVPLNSEGYFFEPLWTNWRVGAQNGILDWYTVMCGVVALVTLLMHGSLYLALKTEGELNARVRKVASLLWPVQVVLTILSLVATIYAVPHVLENYSRWPIGYLVPAVVVGSLAYLSFAHARRNERGAFLASCAYIVGMLVGAAFALYPNVLPASTGPNFSLTIHNSATGAHGLAVGLVWWTIGMILALGYFVFVYRMFRGKVRLEESSEHGY